MIECPLTLALSPIGFLRHPEPSLFVILKHKILQSLHSFRMTNEGSSIVKFYIMIERLSPSPPLGRGMG